MVHFSHFNLVDDSTLSSCNIIIHTVVVLNLKLHSCRGFASDLQLRSHVHHMYYVRSDV